MFDLCFGPFILYVCEPTKTVCQISRTHWFHSGSTTIIYGCKDDKFSEEKRLCYFVLILLKNKDCGFSFELHEPPHWCGFNRGY